MTERIQTEIITINMLCPGSCWGVKRRDESQRPLSSFGNRTLRPCHGFPAENVQTYEGAGIASCCFSCLGEPTTVVQLCFPPCGCIFSRLVVIRPCRGFSGDTWSLDYSSNYMNSGMSNPVSFAHGAFEACKAPINVIMGRARVTPALTYAVPICYVCLIDVLLHTFLKQFPFSSPLSLNNPIQAL